VNLGSVELSNTACSGQMTRWMWVHLLQPGLWCRPDTAQTTHVGIEYRLWL